MIRLNLISEPRWIELLPGLRLQVAPVTTAVMASAGTDPLLAYLDKATSEGDVAAAMAKAVARRVVLDWEGVGDDAGDPLTISPEGIDALLDLWPVFKAFQVEVLGPQLLLGAEKNVSAPSPTGTTAGARATAKPARRPAKTARKK